MPYASPEALATAEQLRAYRQQLAHRLKVARRQAREGNPFAAAFVERYRCSSTPNPNRAAALRKKSALNRHLAQQLQQFFPDSITEIQQKLESYAAIYDELADLAP